MISVCIATFNGERFIKEQIVSILSQLKPHDEIIISDNNSEDLTLPIIKSINDSRIKIYNCNSLSIVKNFENALLHSSGDYIFLSDQDDIWLDGKVKSMENLLNDADLIMSDGYVVNESLIRSGLSIYDVTQPRYGTIRNLLRNSFTGCCMAFNRKILDAALPFPDLLPMHDWWLGLVAQSVGQIKIIPDKLILYRRHNLNASTLTTKSRRTLSDKIAMRVRLFIYVFRRTHLISPHKNKSDF